MTAEPPRGALVARARAKINLTLTVHGRRADGHHDLTSLVAFAGVGDALSLTPAEAESLSVAGPFGHGLDVDGGNLVLRAAAQLRERVPTLRSGAFHLVKRLPVASGIGGGSADAAAALRLLARLNGIPLHDARLMAAARACGADVPVCLASQARVMSGVGERLHPLLRLPALFAVLVNPGIGVMTAEVFKGLGLERGQQLRHGVAAGGVGSWLEESPDDAAGFRDAVIAPHPNDLEPPALALCPAIGDAIVALGSAPGCRLARMSGSGATCFGLFDDCRASAAAAKGLARAHPDWWVKATVLR
jgi:4-diphosphocytidyl-2-C-methyl-D-erythritol kinase